VVSVRAGAADPQYWPAQSYSDVTIPRPEHESPSEQTLRGLYEAEAVTPHAPESLEALGALHDQLDAEHPSDWLLRWNLLERLTQLGADPERRARLAAELWRLELHFDRKHPIASGLAYLGYGREPR
jgi:hypothetical protein